MRDDQYRRRFLKELGIAAGISLGAGWAALAPRGWPLSLRDPDGERGKPGKTTLKLPQGGFAVPASALAADLGVARGENVKAMLRSAVDAIGGIARFVKKGDVVLIKPNVAFERAAPLGATSNPEVVAALVWMCREAGATDVRVADNPIESPESCFVRSGVRLASLEAGLIHRWPFFWRPFVGVTKVIGVAPVKDHNLCRASMTTKNWYGLLGGRRNQFHQDIHGIIADLATMMRPTFVVLDGTRVLFRSGPTGGSLADVKPGRTLVASADSLAADAFGWDELLERKGEALPRYFAKAKERGLGTPEWKTLKLKEAQVG